MNKKHRSRSELIGLFVPCFKENFRQRLAAFKARNFRRAYDAEDRIIELCRGLLEELPDNVKEVESDERA